MLTITKRVVGLVILSMACGALQHAEAQQVVRVDLAYRTRGTTTVGGVEALVAAMDSNNDAIFCAWAIVCPGGVG